MYAGEEQMDGAHILVLCSRNAHVGATPGNLHWYVGHGKLPERNKVAAIKVEQGNATL